jgi:hypothetical protein
VQSRIFGPKREEVIGGWRKLHNEELHNVYSPQYIIRAMKWVCVEHTDKTTDLYKISVGNREGKEDIGRPSSK